MFSWLSRMLDAILSLMAYVAGRQDAELAQARKEVEDVQKVAAARADRAFMRRVRELFRRD